MMFYCVFVTFPCGILGQVWYLIVSIPDLYYFNNEVCQGRIKDLLKGGSNLQKGVRFINFT